MIARESVSVLLKITSATLTPQDIEARLGVKPDEAWKIGDRTGVFGAVEKVNGYMLVSALLPTAALEEHVQSMLRRVAPVAAKIGEFASSATIKMICTVQRKSIPPLGFSRDDLRRLSAMGAQLDIEVSVIADPARAAPRAGAPDPNQTPPTTSF